jgi:hypothetical protein
VEFAYDGNGIAKGGGLSLYLDGNKVGEGRLEQTEPFIFSADETLDIGFESGSSVTSDYNRNRFSGEVNWVQIDVSEDANDLDHFLTRQERLVDRGRLRRWITSGSRLAQRLVAQGMSRPASGRGSGDTNTLLSSACRRLALPCEGRRHAAPCLKASQQAISQPETSSACWEPLPPQLYANHGQGYSATSTWP